MIRKVTLVRGEMKVLPLFLSTFSCILGSVGINFNVSVVKTKKNLR